MQESDTNDDAYFNLKKAIVKKFGPKRAEGFDKAITRVMSSTPSHLGYQILSDICPAVRPLQGCHCADTILGIWRRSLPSAVRNAIADLDFNGTTYEAVFEKADNVWASNSANTTVVAALSRADVNGPEVSAVQANRGRNNRNRGGGRGNRGGAAGGGAGQRRRGPRHKDSPPPEACDLHWKFGKSAWTCADRHNCPWRNHESPRPKDNRNVIAGAEIVD